MSTSMYVYINVLSHCVYTLLYVQRNLQGIIATSCNIDGRVKLDEFVRITTKLMSLLKDDKAAHHKKLITPLKLTVVGSSIPGSEAALNYKKFIDEFGTDSRVGLSNLGCKTANSNPQLYVLPPSLTKSCLSVFSCFDGDTTTSSSSGGGSDHFLYGVLTSKDPGPAQYTKEGVVVMSSSSSSGSSSSPSTAMKSSIPSVVSSSSVPSQGGAMKISSSTSSIGSGAAASAIQHSGTKSTSPSATAIGTTAPTKAIASLAAAPTIVPPPMRSGVAPTPSASSTTPAPPARPPVPPTKPTTTSMHSIAPPPKPTTQVSPSTHTQNKSISPSNPTATTTNAVTTSAVASSTTTASDDPIYRVAIFCAGRGVQAIRDLQAKAEARSVMPFIFDGHVDHPKFVQMLKELVEAKGNK